MAESLVAPRRPLGPLAAGLGSGAIPLVPFLRDLCRRVEAVEPSVRALLPEDGRLERLIRDAEALLARFPDPARRPSLFGVPVGIKDLLRVDGFPTRAGSELPAEAFEGPESSAVSRLKSAGMLILGKTATDEFAYSDPPETCNPHDLGRTPGGSSAGSAAAVAAGLCPLAVGTQTSRSLIAPAAYCGVVGFKPSYGRVPVDGVVLLSPSMDTVGLLAPDVAGAGLGASVLVDGWEPAEVPRPVLGIPEGRYLNELPEEGWRPPFEAAIRRLEAAGFEVRRTALGWDVALDDVYHTAMDVLHAEMALAHRERFARFESLYGKASRAGIARGQGIPAADLAAGRDAGRRLRVDLGARMDTAGVDLLLSPSQPGPAPALGQQTGSGATTAPWSLAGLPCLSLPCGTIGGLPAGLQGIGRYGADERLLSGMETVAGILEGEG